MIPLCLASQSTSDRADHHNFCPGPPVCQFESVRPRRLIIRDAYPSLLRVPLLTASFARLNIKPLFLKSLTPDTRLALRNEIVGLLQKLVNIRASFAYSFVGRNNCKNLQST